MTVPVRVLIADDHSGVPRRPGLAARHPARRHRRGHGCRWRRGGRAHHRARARRGGDGPADAPPQRHRRHPPARRGAARRARARLHDGGGGRDRPRRDAGRCPRLPGQGRQPGGGRPGDRHRARRRPGLRRLPRAAHRRPAVGHRDPRPVGVPPAHRAGGGDPRPDRRRQNNAQIAAALFLAPKTVRNNVSNILAKLQATDRAEAIIRARDAGLGGG